MSLDKLKAVTTMVLSLGLLAWFPSVTRAQSRREIGGQMEQKQDQEKRLSPEFRDKPWGDVLQWLADETRLPVISGLKLAGTFTNIPPQGKTYSIPEVIDILNEALAAQPTRYTLIRRERNFLLVPTDELVRPFGRPSIVDPKELGHRGKDEVVQLVLPLVRLKAAVVAPEVQKQLGPFGEVSTIEPANQLVLQDNVRNLSRICAMLTAFEQ